MKKATLLTDMFALPQNPQSTYLSDYLIIFYDKTAGSVDKSRALHVIYLNFGNGLKTSTIFLYPSFDITTWIGEPLDG